MSLLHIRQVHWKVIDFVGFFAEI